MQPDETKTQAGFRALMAEVYNGDAEAGRILFEEYGSLLLRVVRRHLNPALRSQADSTDFIQETWLTFLKDLPKGREFETPSQLAAFLALIARNKVIDAVRRGMMAERANVNREISLQRHAGLSDNLPGAFSTPSQACVRRELEETLLDEMRPAHQFIGKKLLQGLDPKEISDDLGVSLRTVERIRERIVERLQKL